MTFRLKRPDALASQLRKIARDQLERAAADLEGDDIHQGIHQSRKRCKRVRALIRLVRTPLGDEYDRVNVALRETARSLSAVRDATALLGSLDDLEERYLKEVKTATFRSARQALEHEREQVAADHDLPSLAEAAAASLRRLGTEVERWPLDDDLRGQDLIADCANTYDRGRKAMGKAADGDPEKVHEWRKRCKYLRHELRLLRNCWKRPLTAVVKDLDRLGDQLGDHHDLVVLHQTLEAFGPEALGGERTAQSLLGVIGIQLRELVAVAGPLGQRIWAEGSDDFAARLKAYWRAWEHSPDHPVMDAAPNP